MREDSIQSKSKCKSPEKYTDLLVEWKEEHHSQIQQIKKRMEIIMRDRQEPDHLGPYSLEWKFWALILVGRLLGALSRDMT